MGLSCYYTVRVRTLLMASMVLGCHTLQQRAAEEECLEFLRKNMPERDHGKVTESLLQEHITLALLVSCLAMQASCRPDASVP